MDTVRHSSTYDLRKLSAKAFTKGALALRRELHRARSRQTASLSVLHAVLANQRAEQAGEVWSALAPIQTGPAENPPRMLGAPLQDSANVHPYCGKTRNAGVRHYSGIASQFDIAVAHKPVGDRYTKLTGQMVVAGSRATQCEVLRAN